MLKYQKIFDFKGVTQVSAHRLVLGYALMFVIILISIFPSTVSTGLIKLLEFRRANTTSANDLKSRDKELTSENGVWKQMIDQALSSSTAGQAINKHFPGSRNMLLFRSNSCNCFQKITKPILRLVNATKPWFRRDYRARVSAQMR
jgi:hypothetical protein